MSSGRKTMTVFVTLLSGLILVIAGIALHWPRWAWPALGAVLVAVAVLVHRVIGRDSEEFPRELMLEPDLPIPTAPRQEERVSDVVLPSCVADYDFVFSATVRWALLDPPDGAPLINPAGLAVDAVLKRAREITAVQPPTRSALAQHALDGALGVMRPDRTGRVLAMAQDVSLSLPGTDLERLAKLSAVRKDEDVWEHERNHERNKRAYLGNDVLKDTGSAVVWWLARNEEKVEAAVDRIGVLARLTAAANNEEVAPEFQHLLPPPPGALHGTAEQTSTAPGPAPEEPFSPEAADAEADVPVADLLGWFGFGPDDPDLLLFAERLADIADKHGRPQAAEAIKRHVDQPPAPGHAPDEPPGEPPAADHRPL
ncbi:hypothetical protein ACFWXK_19225 [Streptomyces sp. NPDC059070]|uniref:hypothetical protein n=1 Tax=Streptomyces sp. NPDC059070 TaxID=3346713 RepID=UPI0036AE6402